MGQPRLRRPRARLLRPEGTCRPLRRHDARELHQHHGHIACFSFTEIAKRAAELMPNGGSMITLSYGGATRWVPSYNVMGVAKAALEASVRYLAADLGPKGIRVNALSAGPMRTLSGAGVWRRARHLQLPARKCATEAHAERSTKSAARRSISCRPCRARSRAKCTSSTAVTIPFRCRTFRDL